MLYMTSINHPGGTSPPEKRSVDELIVAVGQGDKNAFEELYRIFAPEVYAYALAVLKNPADAQDALQDCFVALHNAAPRYKDTGKGRHFVDDDRRQSLPYGAEEGRAQGGNGRGRLDALSRGQKRAFSRRPTASEGVYDRLGGGGARDPDAARRFRFQTPRDRRPSRAAAFDRPFQIQPRSQKTAETIRRRRE